LHANHVAHRDLKVCGLAQPLVLGRAQGNAHLLRGEVSKGQQGGRARLRLDWVACCGAVGV